MKLNTNLGSRYYLKKMSQKIPGLTSNFYNSVTFSYEFRKLKKNLKKHFERFLSR